MDSNNQETYNKKLVLLKSAFTGAATGMASLPFEHPFDALKTNMQSRQTKIF